MKMKILFVLLYIFVIGCSGTSKKADVDSEKSDSVISLRVLSYESDSIQTYVKVSVSNHSNRTLIVSNDYKKYFKENNEWQDITLNYPQGFVRNLIILNTKLVPQETQIIYIPIYNREFGKMYTKTGDYKISIYGKSVFFRMESDILKRTAKRSRDHYSHQQLFRINKEIWEKLDKLKGTPVANNVSGGGVGMYFVEIDLMRNTPEKQKEFREKVMDSPAINFRGAAVDPVDNSVGVNDTMGVYLASEYPVYSTQTKEIKLFLYNRSGTRIGYGEGYSMSYQSKDNTWRKLPFHDAITDVLYHLPHNDSDMFTAYLHPDVNNNKAGCYRYFHEIMIGNRRLCFMAKFHLSDNEREWKNIGKTVLPKKFQTGFPSIEEKVFDRVEEMPQFPGGVEEQEKFINQNISKVIASKGRVIVRCVVERDGKLDQLEVIHTSDKALNEEAIRIIKKMPRWIPGKMNDTSVKVRTAIRIRFNETERYIFNETIKKTE